MLAMDKMTFIRRIRDRLKLALGGFDSLKHVDAKKVERLVFVCRGNVCRSPYAEAAAKSLGISATSCGVDVRISAPAQEMAIRAARLRGKDLSEHMSRSIHDLSLNRSDCLVAMDPSHLSVSREVASKVGCQLTLIGLWQKSPNPEIADPYGKPLEAFTKCFDEIDETISVVTSNIRRL